MADLKIGRLVFDITEKDVVMYNCACWQLITQKIRKGWRDYTPKLSKILCEKFVKKGILVLFKEDGGYVTADGRQMGLSYYKFDIPKLVEYLSKES